ncbi:hypothetical protein [Bifidobacterium bohemicum]|nr:hypothetical protein [Bifidobacterium bohemicum]
MSTVSWAYLLRRMVNSASSSGLLVAHIELVLKYPGHVCLAHVGGDEPGHDGIRVAVEGGVVSGWRCGVLVEEAGGFVEDVDGAPGLLPALMDVVVGPV